jgi:hypothetical protein
MRCAFYHSKKPGCTYRGTCKSSWIAETFGVSLSKAKEARRTLGELGWLRTYERSQPYQNRNGASVEIVPTWEASGKEAATKSGPLPSVLVLKSGPPDSYLEPPSESKYQKPAPAPGRPRPGLSKRKQPNIRHVEPEDLKDTARLLELYRQAVEGGIARPGEMNRLKFVAAAERALRVATANPPGFFATLVSKGRWYASLGDEEMAHRRLKKHLYGEGAPVGARAGPWSAQSPPVLSSDAQFVRDLELEFLKRGLVLDPLPALQRERPGWTEARWNRAKEELRAAAGRAPGASGAWRLAA